MKDSQFFRQAELLLQILPFFKKQKVFALKGGTALNFFFQDLPRLSVDIDFTYLPVNDRELALTEISESLKQASDEIQSKIPAIKISYKKHSNSEKVFGLLLQRKNVTVKVEPNIVIRGAAFDPIEKTLCKAAQDLFELSFSFMTLSKEDLYGGKICAALDRQHPQDLFDIKTLLENEGITENIRKAFIVYLLSHPRPIVELLNPNFIYINDIFNNEFAGMTGEPIELKELLDVRSELVRLIQNGLTEIEKHFILSVKKGEPDWHLFDINHVKELPAVKWKLANIKKMDSRKHKAAVEKLQKFLGL